MLLTFRKHFKPHSGRNWPNLLINFHKNQWRIKHIIPQNLPVWLTYLHSNPVFLGDAWEATNRPLCNLMSSHLSTIQVEFFKIICSLRKVTEIRLLTSYIPYVVELNRTYNWSKRPKPTRLWWVYTFFSLLDLRKPDYCIIPILDILWTTRPLLL